MKLPPIQRIVPILLGSFLFIWNPGSINGQESGKSPIPDFKTFKIVTDRNIFDPNRQSVTRTSRTQPRQGPTQPEERLRLLGTLINDKQSFAFFEGSKSEYNKELKIGDSIADFKIQSIQTQFVKLENKGIVKDVPVGDALVRREGSDWELKANQPSFETAKSPNTAPNQKASNENTKTPESKEDTKTSGSNDLLQKMMERRQKEMNQ